MSDEPEFCDDAYDALDGADALLIVTGWKVYADADLAEVSRRMRGNLVIDGRNLWVDKAIPENLRYEGIGRGNL